ncbi:hypothetical protein ACIQI7_31960 [Kitasatospora sp. NPDC092039]|uniref:hypothetical protein n=1 Tax=Kitasatospora sp. NPDC092039 TaxID=3364086 RepID=UPI0038062460
MNAQIGRPSRRPLAQPFSHASAATDEPSTERLLPAERLGSPFSVPAAPVPATRSAGDGRRPLGEGGLSYTAGPAGD